MYVKSYETGNGSMMIFIDRFPRPDGTIWGPSECQWMVPGTVDPRDD